MENTKEFAFIKCMHYAQHPCIAGLHNAGDSRRLKYSIMFSTELLHKIKNLSQAQSLFCCLMAAVFTHRANDTNQPFLLGLVIHIGDGGIHGGRRNKKQVHNVGLRIIRQARRRLWRRSLSSKMDTAV